MISEKSMQMGMREVAELPWAWITVEPRQLKLQLAPLALAGMSLRNVQQIFSDVENHLKM